MSKRYAIIGFGCAGYQALTALRESNMEAEIHVFSDLGEPPANPMLTTYYAAGRLPYEALFPFGSLEDIERRYSPVLHMDTARHRHGRRRAHHSLRRGDLRPL